MPAPRYWTPEEDQRLLDLVRNGATLKSCASLLGRSLRAVSQRASYMRRHGEHVEPSRWTPPMDAALRDLMAQGLSHRAIADKIGVSDKAVARRAQRMGLRPRNFMDEAQAITRTPLAMRPLDQEGARQRTQALELAYCEAADRNGWVIQPYKVAA